MSRNWACHYIYSQFAILPFTTDFICPNGRIFCMENDVLKTAKTSADLFSEWLLLNTDDEQ